MGTWWEKSVEEVLTHPDYLIAFLPLEVAKLFDIPHYVLVWLACDKEVAVTPVVTFVSKVDS